MAKGHDRLTPEGKRFYAELEQLVKLQVRIGYQSGAATKDGVDMAVIAAANELGTPNIPARPFLRNTADSSRDDIKSMCRAQLGKILKGDTAEDALNRIGVRQKGLVQDTISKSKEWAAPNAQSTIDRKSSDSPLVDKGSLMGSVNYVVVPKGTEKD